MPQYLKSAIKYLASILVMLLFLYLSFRGTDFQLLWLTLEHANYWWVLAMLPPLLVSHVLRAWRWQYMMRPIKKDIRFRNLWSALIVGYMVNNVLPKVGEIVRPYAIGKLEGVSRSAAFGTVIVERIFDILSFMFCIALLPVLYDGPLTQSFPWLAEVSIWLTLGTLAFAALFVFLMFRRDVAMGTLKFITGRMAPARGKRIEHIAHSFLDGFLFVKDTENYLMIGLLSVLIWVLYIIMMYLPFNAFDMVAKYNLGWRAATIVQAISSIGIMIPTPGSTGPYHYFTIQTLTQLYKVSGEDARGYAATTHALGIVSMTLLGLYYFIKDKLHIAEARGIPVVDPPATAVSSSP